MEHENTRLRNAFIRENHEITQALGKALGYPWFKDDQKNFPGATEKDGVCVGEHVAASLASEAASRIKFYERLIKEIIVTLELSVTNGQLVHDDMNALRGVVSSWKQRFEAKSVR